MVTKLIEQSDPRYFTQTSDLDYDRHNYKLVYEDGRSKEFDSWERVQSAWFQTHKEWLSHIEVIDIAKSKTAPKGFS